MDTPEYTWVLDHNSASVLFLQRYPGKPLPLAAPPHPSLPLTQCPNTKHSLVDDAIAHTVSTIIALSSSTALLADAIKLVQDYHVQCSRLLRVTASGYLRGIVKQGAHVRFGRPDKPFQDLRPGHHSGRARGKQRGEPPCEQGFPTSRGAVQQQTPNGRYAQIFQEVGWGRQRDAYLGFGGWESEARGGDGRAGPGRAGRRSNIDRDAP